jgi:hypothetical protein
MSRLKCRSTFVAKSRKSNNPKNLARKSISGVLCCCIACQRHYGGRCSILDETIWSLTSPRVKRISGSKNFRSTPQKDFCNKIGGEADLALGRIGAFFRAPRGAGTADTCCDWLRGCSLRGWTATAIRKGQPALAIATIAAVPGTIVTFRVRKLSLCVGLGRPNF